MSKYFSKATTMVGCDIDPKCGALSFPDPRLTVIIGDASSHDTADRVKAVSKDFDIVIDDGSHTSHDIVGAFCHYFPLINEGGLFIAEDLNCSYWQAFQGGVVHPQSSMQFFKLLADVINQQHWGTSSRRKDLLKGILDVYQFDIDERELAKVYSVKFVNSMCIIEKKAPEAVLLGKRQITGEQFLVADNAPYNQSDAIRIDQSNNPYANLKLADNARLAEAAGGFGSTSGAGLQALEAKVDTLYAVVDSFKADVQKAVVALNENIISMSGMNTGAGMQICDELIKINETIDRLLSARPSGQAS